MPAIRFDGQVAVVTGAGRGLGAAYARLLATRGGAVVVHDAGVAQDGSGFDPSVADGVVAEIAAQGGMAAACYENLEDSATGQRIVDFAIRRFGRLDALVHNAGLVVFAALDETTPAVWDRMIAIGVDAGFHLARAAVPHMRRQGYGRIVLTTSGRAMRVEDCMPGLVAYSTAKMAQVGLMVGLAAELADTDIRVNAISPVAATRVLRRQAPELLPELVAPGVAFLASSACTTSGAVLNAAGGRFSASWWDRGEVVDLGATASPETIAGTGGASWRLRPSRSRLRSAGLQPPMTNDVGSEAHASHSSSLAAVALALAALPTIVPTVARADSADKSITISEPKVQVIGNNAVARHTYAVEFESDGKPGSPKIGVMQVWVTDGGNWKLLARQAFRTS